jgi:hypothetical protein
MFTPVFSAISAVWLTAEQESQRSGKEQRNYEDERLCLAVMRILAAAGATLDFEAKICVPSHFERRATLLHIAAMYACLYHGRAFKRRQAFLLEVAQVLADNLAPSACAALFWRRCKVDGQNAVSVCLRSVFVISKIRNSHKSCYR